MLSTKENFTLEEVKIVVIRKEHAAGIIANGI